MARKGSVEEELSLLECDIEINKYHISMAMSLIMPFLLSFASIGIAASDQTSKYVFLGLSIFMFFILAGMIFFDSNKLIKKYKLKRTLISKKFKE